MGNDNGFLGSSATVLVTKIDVVASTDVVTDTDDYDEFE